MPQTQRALRPVGNPLAISDCEGINVYSRPLELFIQVVAGAFWVSPSKNSFKDASAL